jgi:hypothetical protein
VLLLCSVQLVYVVKPGPVTDLVTASSLSAVTATAAVGASVTANVTNAIDKSPLPPPERSSDASHSAESGEPTTTTTTASMAVTVAEVPAADRDHPISAIAAAAAPGTEGTTPVANNSGLLPMASDVPRGALRPLVRRAAHFQEVSEWICPRDHNHLRMTRIIKSLILFGLRDEAQAFFSALHEVVQQWPRRINPETIQYWREASLYDP